MKRQKNRRKHLEQNMYRKQRKIKQLPYYIPTAEIFKLYEKEPLCAFLDSSLVNDLGQYSVIGRCPYLKLVKDGNNFWINGKQEEERSFEDYMRKYLMEHEDSNDTGLPIMSGAIGYFSYDYIKYGEQSLNLNANDEEKFNDVDLMLFDKVIAFDNYRQKIILIVNIKVENLEVNYRKAEIELKAMADLIINGKKAEERPLKIKSDYRSYFSKEQYCNMVVKAKE